MRLLLWSLIVFNVTMLYLVITSLGYVMNIYFILLSAFISGISILAMLLGLVLILISKYRRSQRALEIV
jgi:hypothetical protein